MTNSKNVNYRCRSLRNCGENNVFDNFWLSRGWTIEDEAGLSRGLYMWDCTVYIHMYDILSRYFNLPQEVKSSKFVKLTKRTVKKNT